VTQIISVIGYPLKHSVSPHFQQAALDYYKLDIRYEAREIKTEDLPSAINQLRQPQNLGANVTIPYKETVLHLVDEVDDFVGLVGAVNTVVNRDGRLMGLNTDAHGFLKALREDAMFEPENKRAVVLGAGGAARAVCFALLLEKVSSLTIANRALDRAENLGGFLAKHASSNNISTDITALPWQSPKLTDAIKHCQLIVNCTNLGTKCSPEEGQSPLTSGLIPKDALVYDLVYNPSETPLMRMAKEAGAKAIGGLPMLIYQGAASFKIWTDREAPLDIMITAARQALLRVGG
jgi:shikimate dehydrogenase